MSSLSNLPYGKILDYWYEKLSGNRQRIPFLFTKTVEVFSFKSKAPRNFQLHSFTPFHNYKSSNIPANPVVSIVIPCFIKNKVDLANLSNLLLSIQQQTIKPHNIIIVDDYSPLNYIVEKEIHFSRLEKNSGPARARNKGKEVARELSSDIIAFTDTDCILHCDWIKNIVQGFEENKECNILSGNTISFDKHWFGTYHNINGTLNGRRFKTSDHLLYGTTANLAITAEVNNAVSFNEEFLIAAGEDIEFCFRSNQMGFAIKHIPEMIVQHNFGYSSNPVRSFNRFTYQFRKYGAGEKILLKFVPDYYAYFDQTTEVAYF